MIRNFQYPKLRKENIIDKNGLPDPYRWIEGNLETEEVVKWVDAQNSISEDYLSVPIREKIRSRLSSLYNYEKYSCPMIYGNKYYFYYNTGLQNQSVLYVQDNLKSEPKVVLDPNSLSKDGTVSINELSFSDNGEYFAYGLSKSGSDWVTCYIKDLKKNEDFPEKLEWIKFSSFEWTKDGLGFFYVRYPEQNIKEEERGKEINLNTNQTVYYHRIGTPQEEDIVIFNPVENPNWFLYPLVSDDGDFLMITIYEGTDDECKLYLAKIDNICSDMKFNKIVDNFEHKVAYITNQKEKFYFKTNYNAQNKQIMLMDLNHPEKKDWKTIVPETKNPMTFAYCFNDKYLLIGYSIDVIDVIQMNKIDNGEFIKNIELPSLGTVGLSLQKHQEEFFFKFTSFLYPGTIFRYSLANNISECFKEIKVPNFNRDNFNTEQIFYQSKDGTKIPMFLIYRKGLELNGKNPFFLYGYGGFDISIKPSFSSMDICLMENLNVSMAIANIRGGGEYGDFWHESAKKEKKQNCFDDFHFAAEYLIKNKYTSPEKLVINGASNGGLLVAVCANQRPDLYSCVIVSQGVLDMLRYHLYTIGYAWKTEYGDPDISEDFNYLIKYSPIHNVNEKAKYPAILVRTSDYDDRVVPVHSYKYISVLQEKLENNEKPLLILIEKKAGHGAGKPTQKRIDDCSNNFTFIALTLGLQYEEK